ncbi:MAG: cation-translocating P-type ATPase [Cyanothece sp. SIO1E1]|nr:cation-translocating P-type ATPase [Cyanothece sp. SIO1E1]
MVPDPLPNLSVDWHTLASDQALELLQSNGQTGLTADQIVKRQQRYGPNELMESSGRTSWAILLDQFKNVMLLMLIAVAIVSAGLDLKQEHIPKDAIAIFLIVFLNGLLGYLQESRAEKALAALKQLVSPLVRVIRAGRPIEVAAQALVPGDILLIEAGMQIAADGRLLEAINLQLREAALTGEANAVTKQSALVLAADTTLGDRLNMVFKGTEVVQGRATILVTATGMQTELGRIAAMLQAVETEPTPLQQRMTQLGNVLVMGSLILVALVVSGGILYSGWQAFENLLEVSLSMAVAVVPEGLPAVITVTLALGTQRMVRRQALIRKLPAVETLGSVTTICSDKTGTLTQNKMVVQAVKTASTSCQVTGSGYNPTGEFCHNSPDMPPEAQPNFRILLMACLLCNDAVLQQAHDGDWVILGDPTEGALLALAGKANLQQDDWCDRLPRLLEFPFSSERKRMSVVVESSAQHSGLDSLEHFLLPRTSQPLPGYLMFAKGSPELLLECCTQIYVQERIEFLTEAQRFDIHAQNEQMTRQGLRVLGIAYRPLDKLPAAGNAAAVEQELIWLGLVGMHDAPRPEVRQAVARCRQAGIRPVMITGDHQLTAQALAQDLGVVQPGDRTLNGQALEKMSTSELEAEVQHINVYARVSPEHKLRIVRALQHQNQVVAMTGDGVNDAPALKQANIGIAMGIAGTDVSKEASDMVLLDDNFTTIVAATEEGRVVYTNIRRFVKYILGSNIGEVLTVAASPILVPLGGVPLIPLQILWMNLVTDGLPALALAVEPAEPNVMQRPPYHPRESIFARGLGTYMIRVGIIFTIISVILMRWAYFHTQTVAAGLDPERWKTMVFTTLCIAQMGHALAVRSNTQLTLELNPFSNPYLLAAVVLTTLLQLMLIYVEPLRHFFGTHLLSPLELGICFGFSALVFVWVESEKLFLRWYKKR